MRLKKFKIRIPVFILLFILSGCGKAAFSVGAVVPQKWAQKLLTGTKFTDQMTKIDTAAALKRYTVTKGDVSACAVYVGTGATAEEVSVWKAKDTKAAETISQDAKRLVQSQKNTYASYRPEEVSKLDNAVVEQKATVVVVCVCADDEKAKQVIDGLFNGR